MERCPKCKSKKFRKDGRAKQRQRYKCNDCNYRFTVERIGKPNKLKRDALVLYLQGLGFRAIGRFLNVSNVTVLNWIRSFGKKVAEIRSPEKIEIVEMDEMHRYLDSKRTVADPQDGEQYGLLLIEIGSKSSIVKLASGESKHEKGSGKH